MDNSQQSLLAKGYKPKQHLPFSHKLHAGELKMDCQYCHSAARRSPVAGIPGTGTCMGCHRLVGPQEGPLALLRKKHREKAPIPWVRVHDLPDYVRFSHEAHLRAKDPKGRPLFQCQHCHGPVEKMKELGQWAPLQMGWCVQCHVKHKAPRDCSICHY